MAPAERLGRTISGTAGGSPGSCPRPGRESQPESQVSPQGSQSVPHHPLPELKKKHRSQALDPDTESARGTAWASECLKNRLYLEGSFGFIEKLRKGYSELVICGWKAAQLTSVGPRWGPCISTSIQRKEGTPGPHMGTSREPESPGAPTTYQAHQLGPFGPFWPTTCFGRAHKLAMDFTCFHGWKKYQKSS